MCVILNLKPSNVYMTLTLKGQTHGTDYAIVKEEANICHIDDWQDWILSGGQNFIRGVSVSVTDSVFTKRYNWKT